MKSVNCPLVEIRVIVGLERYGLKVLLLIDQRCPSVPDVIP